MHRDAGHSTTSGVRLLEMVRVWPDALLVVALSASPCRPTELPRTVPSGLKNGTKLLRLKINKQGQPPQSQQQHADTASGLGASSSSSSQQSTSFLYSAQVGIGGVYTQV